MANDYDTAKIREITPEETHTFLHVPGNTGCDSGVGIFLSNFKNIKKVI